VEEPIENTSRATRAVTQKVTITASYFPLQFHNFHLHQISREIIFGHKYTNDLAIEESTMATE
jgi:hypothetical protein